jgi:DNA-binding response OmpR family regulator
LYYLVRNQGKIISPETLMARVWPNEVVQPETLRVHMSRLRRKVSPSRDTPQYIYTEREVGYSFRLGDEAH